MNKHNLENRYLLESNGLGACNDHPAGPGVFRVRSGVTKGSRYPLSQVWESFGVCPQSQEYGGSA